MRNEDPARWTRQASTVIAGIQIWHFPRPGPRTWAFLLAGDSQLRHYGSQGGAVRAINALLSGIEPPPAIDPLMHVQTYEGGMGPGERLHAPKASQVPPSSAASTQNDGRSSTARRRIVDFSAPTPPGWLADVVAGARAPFIDTHRGEGADIKAWTVELALPRYVGDSARRLDPWNVDYGKVLVEPNRPELLGGSCAEVELVERFRLARWDAWWSDGYGQAPSRWQPWIRRARAWQGAVGELLEAVRKSRTDDRAGGVPDVVGIRASQILLVECKGADTFKSSQIGWLEGARAIGVDGGLFAVCRFEVVDSGIRSPDSSRAGGSA